MNEIKLNLSIELPGSTMLSKEECLKTTYKVIEKKTKAGKIYEKTIEVKVENWDKMEKHSMRVANTNGTNPEIITFHTRKCKPATQSLSMSKEAYEYMIDKDSCPSWSKPGKWAAMSEKERLEAHLQRTVEYLGGISYTYRVFED
jgi:hypothetical protein